MRGKCDNFESNLFEYTLPKNQGVVIYNLKVWLVKVWSFRVKKRVEYDSIHMESEKQANIRVTLSRFFCVY